MELFKSTGRRKTSIARVILFSGNGQIKVNNLKLLKYFSSKILRIIIKKPLNKLFLLNQYNVFINVKGGGFKSQAEAIQLGISRALCKININYKINFKKYKFLTRDSRIVERKKSGRKKARKKFQFSKR